MRRFALCPLIFLLLLPISSAQIVDLDISVEIHDDGLSDVFMIFQFTDDIKEVFFPFYVDYQDVSTTNGNCSVITDVKGNILHCVPPSPFMIGYVTMETKFKTKDFINKDGNITMLSMDVPLMERAEDIEIEIKLPRDTTLSEDVLLPISPSGSSATLEGRRVVVRWSFENKKKGDIIPVRIYYESLIPPNDNDYFFTIIIAAIVIIVLPFMVYFNLRKKKIVRTVLDDNEKTVFDLLNNAKGKTLTQREIVRVTDFSKAKTSRLIKNLQERGLIKVEKVGRKNKITLK